MKRKKGLPSYPGSTLTYVTLGVIIFIESLAIIAQAIFLARSITALFEGAMITDVILDIVLFLVAFLIRQSLTMAHRLVAERFSERMGKELRAELINAYFKNGRQFVNLYGTGRLVTLAVEGIDNMKEYIKIAVPRMIRTGIVPVLIVLYVFTFDISSAAILVVTVPIIVIFMILLGLAAQKMADKQYESYLVLSNHFIDSLKGLETLKYLGQSVAHEIKIGRVSREYRKATLRTLRVAFLSSFALDFFTSLSIAFVAVGLGFRLIEGTLILLPALTILILAPEYFLPLRQVGKDFHATLDGQIALDEIEKIINIEQTVESLPANSIPNWDDSSQIEFKNITLNYDQNPIINDISFNWKGLGMIGIVGESGAGKSTLINILAGFNNPNEGSIYLNDQEISSLNNETWLTQIAYIPQHPYIFPTSLADNIRFYEPEATDEKVKQVINEIGLEDFVAELPNGMAEVLGEGGRTLSGGQEQRIAMARALLSKKPILLLDEPTAHLDIETEYEIKQVMLRVFQDKLVFFATHRIHWMKEMDHLLVLKDGVLVEQGAHQTLYEQRNNYYHLITSLIKGGENK